MSPRNPEAGARQNEALKTDNLAEKYNVENLGAREQSIREFLQPFVEKKRLLEQEKNDIEAIEERVRTADQKNKLKRLGSEIQALPQFAKDTDKALAELDDPDKGDIGGCLRLIDQKITERSGTSLQKFSPVDKRICDYVGHLIEAAQTSLNGDVVMATLEEIKGYENYLNLAERRTKDAEKDEVKLIQEELEKLKQRTGDFLHQQKQAGIKEDYSEPEWTTPESQTNHDDEDQKNKAEPIDLNSTEHVIVGGRDGGESFMNTADTMLMDKDESRIGKSKTFTEKLRELKGRMNSDNKDDAEMAKKQYDSLMEEEVLPLIKERVGKDMERARELRKEIERETDAGAKKILLENWQAIMRKIGEALSEAEGIDVAAMAEAQFQAALSEGKINFGGKENYVDGYKDDASRFMAQRTYNEQIKTEEDLHRLQWQMLNNKALGGEDIPEQSSVLDLVRYGGWTLRDVENIKVTGFWFWKKVSSAKIDGGRPMSLVDFRQTAEGLVNSGRDKFNTEATQKLEEEWELKHKAKVDQFAAYIVQGKLWDLKLEKISSKKKEFAYWAVGAPDFQLRTKEEKIKDVEKMEKLWDDIKKLDKYMKGFKRVEDMICKKNSDGSILKGETAKVEMIKLKTKLLKELMSLAQDVSGEDFEKDASKIQKEWKKKDLRGYFTERTKKVMEKQKADLRVEVIDPSYDENFELVPIQEREEQNENNENIQSSPLEAPSKKSISVEARPEEEIGVSENEELKLPDDFYSFKNFLTGRGLRPRLIPFLKYKIFGKK